MNGLDLIVLTADKNTKAAMEGLLSRPQALGVGSIARFQIIVHPRRDPAVLRDGHHLVRQFLRTARYCLVVFDREGSGEGRRGRAELEREVQLNLDENGWLRRSAVVVIDPELEVWVWNKSPAVDQVLGWPVAGRDLRSWLAAQGHFPEAAMNPPRPMEAVEAALREARISRSSALYLALARRTSLHRCPDPAFAKLRETLKAWFPA